MEDIERYGDYDEIDEAPQGSKNPVTTIIFAMDMSPYRQTAGGFSP